MLSCRKASWLPITLTAISGMFASLSSLADDLRRGEVVYNETCIACHGGDGSGSLPGVPDLGGKAGPLSQADAFLIKRMADGFNHPAPQWKCPPVAVTPH
jgi:mono/diheme cytochrome c family protein